MSKITTVVPATLLCILYTVYIIIIFLAKISREVMFLTICVNYDAKIEAGAGTGPKSRLWLQPITRLRNPAPNSLLNYELPSPSVSVPDKFELGLQKTLL